MLELDMKKVKLCWPIIRASAEKNLNVFGGRLALNPHYYGATDGHVLIKVQGGETCTPCLIDMPTDLHPTGLRVNQESRTLNVDLSVGLNLEASIHCRNAIHFDGPEKFKRAFQNLPSYYASIPHANNIALDFDLLGLFPEKELCLTLPTNLNHPVIVRPKKQKKRLEWIGLIMPMQDLVTPAELKEVWDALGIEASNEANPV